MSERFITIENADMKALHRSAFTSQGVGLLSSAALSYLLMYAQDNESIPTILECYRLKDGMEIPVPEYGLSYPSYQEISQGLSRPAQVSRMVAEFNNKLELLKAEPDLFGFEVWFE